MLTAVCPRELLLLVVQKLSIFGMVDFDTYPTYKIDKIWTMRKSSTLGPAQPWYLAGAAPPSRVPKRSWILYFGYGSKAIMPKSTILGPPILNTCSRMTKDDDVAIAFKAAHCVAESLSLRRRRAGLVHCDHTTTLSQHVR